MPGAFQGGLLAAARAIVHADDRRCARCHAAEALRPATGGLFWRLMEVADAPSLERLVRAGLDPLAVQAFAR